MTDAQNHNFQSWGCAKYVNRSSAKLPEFTHNGSNLTYLPYGNGRSYGDSCLNDLGKLIAMQDGAQIYDFDPHTGVLVADAGVLLHDVLKRVISYGYFLEVTPGTAYVTLGGAIANDVHGKNHHKRGTFGRSVKSFELLRSDCDQPLLCSPRKNKILFNATIGGMGLTGIITKVRLKLMKVGVIDILQKTIRFDNIDQYFDMVDDVDAKHEYSVAWIDQLASGSSFGRGVILAGDHAKDSFVEPAFPRKAKFKVPFIPPFSLVNRLSLKAFNYAYFHKHKKGASEAVVPWQSYFYPLDSIEGWNKLYGPKGLYQHQSVYPEAHARETTIKLLECAKRHGHGSFLTVLKRFGGKKSPGLVSFARKGFTLTLDFSNFGEKTHALLDELDEIVMAAGGAINPYKDARMQPETFRKSFENWGELELFRDPKLNSDFWQRMAS